MASVGKLDNQNSVVVAFNGIFFPFLFEWLLQSKLGQPNLIWDFNVSIKSDGAIRPGVHGLPFNFILIIYLFLFIYCFIFR